MKTSLALLLTVFLSSAAVAERPMVSVKQIGAVFIEAPPGREKNLIPMGSFGAQERVEVHAIIALENRLIADIPTFGDDSKIQVTALLPNKTQTSMGTANASSFRKLSSDAKKTLVSLSISRLPDSGVSGVVFSGIVKLPVALGLKASAAPFQSKVGQRLDVGLGEVVVSNLESDSLTLSGDARLGSVSSVKIVKPDGSSSVGERSAFSRQGSLDRTSVISQWRFSAPIAAGKIEFLTYQDLTTLEVPINLVVSKPY